MSEEKNDLVNGLFFKEPAMGAPRYIVGKLSIGVESFRGWLKDHLAANPDAEWINLEVRIAKSGKPYVMIDDWKPESSNDGFQADTGVNDEDIPF